MATKYTKHYYIEGQRIASKIGGGFAPAIADIEIPVRDPLFGKDYSNISSDLLNMCNRSTKCAGMNPQFVSYDSGLGCVQKFMTEDREEKNLFFYHSDHASTQLSTGIGSSSFITDRTGIASQHLQYLPFGELFVEQQTLTNYSTPYKFSGKEKDEETSYSYFGARYYMSDVSVWLSVDPLADDAPGWTPYRYCFQNPIMLIDPDGRSEENPDGFTIDENGFLQRVDNTGGNQFDVIYNLKSAEKL